MGLTPSTRRTAAHPRPAPRACFAATALLATLVAAAMPAVAQTPVPESVENLDARGRTGVREYWTPDRVLKAEPRPLPQPRVQGPIAPTPTPRIAPTPQPPVEQKQDDGQEPSGDAARPNSGQRLFPSGRAGEIKPRAEAPRTPKAATPRDAGTKAAFFTSSRLVPANARLEYPYRAVGKVFFQDVDDKQQYVCSAAVIQPRLVLTAGHCVHRGSGGRSGYHTRLMFVPAYHSGQAPFQSWSYTWTIAAASWQSSGGDVPNKADLALIELEDRNIAGESKTVGQVVGWLGYRTGALLPNHTKKLGYPVSLDNGQIMHQVDSQSFEADTEFTVLYGSDMTGGSSGGPWIENFGVASTGQAGGVHPGRNRVVGVTSYGYIDAGPKVQGSSVLAGEFLQILRIACARKPGNCRD